MHPPPPPPPPPHPPPPPPPSPRTNIPMLYYGLVVVGTAAIILALYNFIVVKWCTELTDHRSRQRANRGRQAPTSPRWRFHDLNSIHLIPSFKYKKDEDCGSECAVCLSVFEEGEELRRLPKCKHSFHAPCIDMWLYSHMDCPLCRSPVDQPVAPQRPQIVVDESEHSREGLLAQATIV